jgi:hypothetical protein
MTKLLALDCATKTGWALGEPEVMPAVSSWRLKGETPHDKARRLAAHLRDLCMIGDISKIAVEDAMRPEAYLSDDVTVLTFLLHGAVDAVAGCYDIPVFRAPAQTIRKHFCGRASANPPRRAGSPAKTPRQRQIDREETKKMVWARAVALGYFSRGEVPDYDKSDAVAVFDWAAHNVARAVRPLALFGGAR